MNVNILHDFKNLNSPTAEELWGEFQDAGVELGQLKKDKLALVLLDDEAHGFLTHFVFNEQSIKTVYGVALEIYSDEQFEAKNFSTPEKLHILWFNDVDTKEFESSDFKFPELSWSLNIPEDIDEQRFELSPEELAQAEAPRRGRFNREHAIYDKVKNTTLK